MRLVFALSCLAFGCSKPTEAPAPQGDLVAEAGGSTFVVDDDFAYVAGAVGWVYHEQGAILRFPLDGGAPATLAVDVNALDEAMDDQSIYLANHDLDASSGSILRLAKDGGVLETVFVMTNFPRQVAVDDTHVYWTASAPDAAAEVMRGPKDGGVSESLGSGQGIPSSLAVDDTHVYWASMASSDAGCWACASIRRVPKDGGSVETLTDQGASSTGLATDDGGAYWTNVESDDAGGLTGSVVRLDKATATTGIVARGSSAVSMGDVGLDSRNVYWSFFDGIYFAPVEGGDGSVEQLAGGETRGGVAIRGGFAYWLDSGGNLRRMATR